MNDTTCGRDNTLTELTLSACSTAQYFTCDSGECIELSARCNETKECADESDEHDCLMVRVEEQYSSDHPPELPDTFNPLITSVEIIQFDKIDTLELTLTFTVQIRIEWVDPRIVFDSIPEYEENTDKELEGRI